jgi:hypothetical protein
MSESSSESSANINESDEEQREKEERIFQKKSVRDEDEEDEEDDAQEQGMEDLKFKDYDRGTRFYRRHKQAIFEVQEDGKIKGSFPKNISRAEFVLEGDLTNLKDEIKATGILDSVQLASEHADLFWKAVYLAKGTDIDAFINPTGARPARRQRTRK